MQAYTKVLSACGVSSCHPAHLLFYSSKLMVNHPVQKKKRAKSVNFRGPFWCLGMDSSSLTDRLATTVKTVSGLEKGKTHTVTLILHKQKGAPEYSFKHYFLPIYCINITFGALFIG